MINSLKYLMTVALSGIASFAMAAGPLCGAVLTCEQTSPACPDPVAYCNWETADNGDVNVTIYKDSQTAWRGRGLAESVTSAAGWSMTIDGTAVDIANYFEKDYTASTDQATAPKVYTLKLKDGVTKPTGTVVIKLVPAKNVCWWTATDNNGWGKVSFEYLYGSVCETLDVPQVDSIAADSTIWMSGVTSSATYTVRIYYDDIMYAVYDGVHSGDQLHFPVKQTADYKVTVIAYVGDKVTEESEAYTWHLDAEAPVLGQSEICEQQFVSDTYSGGPTNKDDSYMKLSFNTVDGNVVVDILPASANAADTAAFRKDDALGTSNFSINGAPASGYFYCLSKDGEHSYVLRLRTGKSLPLGTVIDYNGTLQWKTSNFQNGYRRNTVLHYTYGTTCASVEPEPEPEPDPEPEPEPDVALENTPSASSAAKVLIDGHLYLICGEHMFDATGKMVK